MQIIFCEQRSQEWWDHRRGIVTASQFHRIITPKTMKPSSQQDDLIHELIGQKFANVWPQDDQYISPDMQAGIDNEAIARSWYEFETNVDVTQVGLCISDCGRYSCSPDGLIGTEGGLEIKCPNPKTHARYLLEGVLPDEYKMQIHGNLAVSGYDYWDFVSYSETSTLPPFRLRVLPDETTVKLKSEVERFCDRYAVELAKIEALRG